MLAVAAFLGKSHYTNALKSLGSYKSKLAPAMQTFPSQKPKTLFGSFSKSKTQTMAQLRAEKPRDLNDIVNKSVEDEREPSLTNRWKAQKIDCFLYAQDDQYK